ncbi:MAG: aryl-sulfate sulfotransferase [Nonlabens sp.]|nr:aryl-sulfate sulfotransferase [Nonlabens sp.]
MKNILIIATIAASYLSCAQTVGLQRHDAETLDDGYVLFAPISSTNTFLIDKCGKEVNRWNGTTRPGQSVYLLPNGDLLRTGNVNNNSFNAGGKGGLIQRMDWSGNILWSYTVSSTTELQHHDVKMLPNGNVLIISWELKTAAQAIAAGRNPALTAADVWSEKIIEVQPSGTNGGTIVWEWHLWDHLTQNFDASKPNYSATASEPGLINLNYNATANQEDWIHLNSVDYNPALDQILLSSHGFDEVWIIDHSTTTAQASSHSGGNSTKGGDLLYRWGNPLAYGNGTTASKVLDGQHNAYWVEAGFPYAGEIMIFNNGTGRNFSTVEIINTPQTGFTYNTSLPYAPATTSYTYNAGNTENFYAQNISGSQLLSNGNVLICNGPAGIFTEVNPAGNEVWKYTNPVNATGTIAQGATAAQNAVFRATFYPTTFSGFSGRTLTTGGTLENSNSMSAGCTLTLSMEEMSATISPFSIVQNPSSGSVSIYNPNHDPAQIITITNTAGQQVLSQKWKDAGDTLIIDISSFKAGIYLVQLDDNGKLQTQKLIVN